MPNGPTAGTTVFAITVAALLAFVLIACQSPSPVETPAASTETVAPRTLPTTGETRHYSGRRTLHTETGVPVSAIYVAPQSVQDLVNRSQVVFTGTISEVGDGVSEKAYDWNEEDDTYLKSLGMPPYRITVTYYKIEIEQIFLDDGNLRAYPLMRLLGYNNEVRPKVGERYLFVLSANPDGKSYGIDDNWSLIPLDDGDIRNYDGNPTGYVSVTDENSLLSAIQEAVTNRVYLPNSEWPIHSYWLTDEEADSGSEPAAPGGPDDGESGPAGNVSE